MSYQIVKPNASRCINPFYSHRHHQLVEQLAQRARLGLRQACTDIIRFSHGASSSRKVYRSSFIPGLHDVCMIFERNGA